MAWSFTVALIPIGGQCLFRVQNVAFWRAIGFLPENDISFDFASQDKHSFSATHVQIQDSHPDLNCSKE